jgi:hypothetical protein
VECSGAGFVSTGPRIWTTRGDKSLMTISKKLGLFLYYFKFLIINQLNFIGLSQEFGLDGVAVA